MEYLDFKLHLSGISKANSVKEKKKYINISLKDDQIYFQRESDSYESISVFELYEVYKKCNFINTTILRDYITGRKFSPSFAILIESGLYDKNGHRLNEDIVTGETKSDLNAESSVPIDLETEVTEVSEKDEGRFFAALANLLDSKNIKAKSLFKPVTSSDLILYKSHDKMELDEIASNQMELLLEQLGSNGKLGSGNLERFIDGMIVNHPVLGTRIVEFDEEQHFTPARLVTLRVLKDVEDYPFLDLYIQLCELAPYLNDFVLPKHRVKEKFNEDIVDFKKFQVWLKEITPFGKNNGFIAPKSGFDFIGGRIAQRAYYDTLRDVAHLAKANHSKLSQVIRFPKAYVTLVLKKDFDQVTMGELQKVIAQYLLDYYNYKAN